MCDRCVMQSVRARMASRRGALGLAGAGVAATAAATLAPRPASAREARRVVDLTHRFSPDFPTFGGAPGIALEPVAAFAKDGYNLNEIRVNEHAGTHIDAPLHFSEDGASVDEIPVQNLVAPLAVIDIAARAAEDPDTTVTPDDIDLWIARHGPIPAGACVAMRSGWAAKASGPGFRNFDGVAQHYPGFHVEAVALLLEDGAAASIGVDTLSFDPGNSSDFAAHYAWLPAGRFAIECLDQLEEMPEAGASIVIGAPKTAGGTGGQARVFGLI